MRNVKNIPYVPYCDICKTHNHKSGYGIAFDNGAHVCMECALNICDMLRNCFGVQIPHKEENENIGADAVHGGGN